MHRDVLIVVLWCSLGGFVTSAAGTPSRPADAWAGPAKGSFSGTLAHADSLQQVTVDNMANLANVHLERRADNTLEVTFETINTHRRDAQTTVFQGKVTGTRRTDRGLELTGRFDDSATRRLLTTEAARQAVEMAGRHAGLHQDAVTDMGRRARVTSSAADATFVISDEGQLSLDFANSARVAVDKHESTLLQKRRTGRPMVALSPDVLRAAKALGALYVGWDNRSWQMALADVALSPHELARAMVRATEIAPELRSHLMLWQGKRAVKEGSRYRNLVSVMDLGQKPTRGYDFTSEGQHVFDLFWAPEGQMRAPEERVAPGLTQPIHLVHQSRGLPAPTALRSLATDVGARLVKGGRHEESLLLPDGSRKPIHPEGWIVELHASAANATSELDHFRFIARRYLDLTTKQGGAHIEAVTAPMEQNLLVQAVSTGQLIRVFRLEHHKGATHYRDFDRNLVPQGPRLRVRHQYKR